jgi:putative ABC transport system ATP-binding protein
MTDIKIENLTKRYQANQISITALKSCNLSIESGEWVVITGSKGSGKSTLLHLIGGYDRPTEGKVYLNGIDYEALTDDELALLRRQEIGCIFQNGDILPDLTVEENLFLPALYCHGSYSYSYYEEITDRLGLTASLKLLGRYLPESQRRLAAIARTLLYKPRLLLADDPTRGLSDYSSKEMIDLLMDQFYRDKTTVVFVSNDHDLINYADRVIRLREGSIAEDRRFK